MPKSVEGTHRGAPSSWLALGMPVLGIAAASIVGGGRKASLLALVVVVATMVTVMLIRTPRTKVHDLGVRVRHPRRNVDVHWDDVQDVLPPGRWEMGKDTRLVLRDGTSLDLPGLPAERWSQDVNAYWHAHTTHSASSSDDNHRAG